MVCRKIIVCLLLLMPSGILLAGDFYGLSAKTSEGNVMPFSRFKNKVLLVVNIASECGYTYQLKDLQKVHQEYQLIRLANIFPAGIQERSLFQLKH